MSVPMSRPSRRAVVMSSLGGGALGLLAPGRPVESVQASERRLDGPSPPPPDSKVTVERRGEVCLIGLNRPHIHNRVDPEAFGALARAYAAYDADDGLRAAVLFGHGENFSRGIDVDAFTDVLRTGKARAPDADGIDPLGRRTPLSKPLVAVVHGDTWNMGHELFLVADIRVASADTRFAQDENTHGRFPGGGSTVRFTREAGWGNAMRYMLTGDHWGAEEARRMGLVQEIAPDPRAALDLGLDMAARIARCGPLGIKATLASAHVAVGQSEGTAFSNLAPQYRALYGTEDFLEGRKAEAEGRTPIFRGR
ncbi:MULTISPECIES: crotonase/enoyl-CoA hydratase family protein [Methylobacteriaceae]